MNVPRAFLTVLSALACFVPGCTGCQSRFQTTPGLSFRRSTVRRWINCAAALTSRWRSS